MLSALKYSRHFNVQNGLWDLKFEETVSYNKSEWDKVLQGHLSDTTERRWLAADFDFKCRIMPLEEFKRLKRDLLKVRTYKQYIFFRT
ncbi:MAG: hypothetical protein EOP48_10550 [Sphingobacteriales bacterium]|nr:MAG: hypothetical protein EOP48_10550 [Sphingobacteriales bacterium]